MKKLKVKWEPNPIDDAKTIGYLEGFSDGRNEILKQLEKFDLLKKDWKIIYNKEIKNEGYIIK